MQNNEQPRLIVNMSVRDYFHDSFNSALTNQSKSLSPETSLYIINLLTKFTESSHLFVQVENRNDLKPLAFIYADALNSKTKEKKIACYRYLGDIALFISGLYFYSLNRSLVDVDYYIGMGENAYYSLTDYIDGISNSAFLLIYKELSSDFPGIVELLNEVADNMQTHQHDNLLRLYELFLKNGNDFYARKLRENGIEPNSTIHNTYH